MILDVPPEALREVPDHLTFVDATHGCPSLPLVVSHPMPKPLRQVPLPHPPLYVPHLQLHCLFLGSCRMQKHLHIYIVSKRNGNQLTTQLSHIMLSDYKSKLLITL